MCGEPKVQEVVTRTELDPNLQRMLYGGIFQGAPKPAPVNMVTGGGGGGDKSSSGMFSGGGADNYGNFGAAGDYFGGISDAIGITDYAGAAAEANKNASGGLVQAYAMGGMITPQQGLASLNQGQMPMMNGQLPNLSDPMTAATLAMALRSPQMQYGSVAQNPMMQTNFNVGGYVEGPGTGTSDSIDSVIMQNGRPVQQAKLSDGEFVMTENAVKGAGNGDREAGAARMYELMRQFERGGRV